MGSLVVLLLLSWGSCMGLHTQEKEELSELNDHFTSYVEQVWVLEHRSWVLLLELETPHQHQPRQQDMCGLQVPLEAKRGEQACLEAKRDCLHQTCGQLHERLCPGGMPVPGH
ncbi:UNVERIFIED_CONTAM: hypothetical protein K2H54_038568 [Gekko kuhli]